jgi:hypothetical protein
MVPGRAAARALAVPAGTAGRGGSGVRPGRPLPPGPGGGGGPAYHQPMIRNVVVVKLAAGHDAAEVAKLQDGLRNLGLRDGNWSFAIVGDFTDEAAYRGYDADDEHNRLRAQLAPHVEQICRVQYQLP